MVAADRFGSGALVQDEQRAAHHAPQPSGFQRRQLPRPGNRGDDRDPGSGKADLQPAEITGLLHFYGADLADIERLASLAGSADRQTWWAPWTDVVPDWLRTFVGLGGLASHIAQYAAAVFPALLQTEDYSLGATTGHGRVRPDHDERTVSLRMERQTSSSPTTTSRWC